MDLLKLPHLELVRSKRPKFALSPVLLHPFFDKNALALNSCSQPSPLGIKAISVHHYAGVSLERCHQNPVQLGTRWHYVVPAQSDIGFQNHIWMLADERLVTHNLDKTIGYPAINQNAVEVNEWTISILISDPHIQGKRTLFSKWQIGTTAALIRNTWSRYRNVRHVFSSLAYHDSRCNVPLSLFPWEQLFAAINDDNIGRLTPKQKQNIEEIWTHVE